MGETPATLDDVLSEIRGLRADVDAVNDAIRKSPTYDDIREAVALIRDAAVYSENLELDDRIDYRIEKLLSRWPE